jgi:hypothetical protein
MNTLNLDTSLDYRDSDGVVRTIEGCNLTLDKANRYWLWCESLEHNLAYKARTKEDALLIAIDSLLFTIQLRDERLEALERIHKLAVEFADKIKPDNEEDESF